VGSRPGTLAIPEGSPPPEIHRVLWSPDGVVDREVAELEELAEPVPDGHWIWIDVRGLGDEAVLRRVAEIFGIHDVALEDAVNVPQRAKVVPYEDHLLVIGRVPCFDDDGTVATPQVCFLIGDRHLVTFQERYFGFFDAVRQRLREGIGPIRKQGPDYLAYALVDTLTDHYYPVVEELSESLNELEDPALAADDPETLTRLHEVRRQVAVLRRIGWPQRESIGHLVRDPSDRIGEDVRTYLRGTEDHIAQIMELADSLRDMAVGLTEVFMTQVSHRTNEIMKVLTLMASIFIPLTFIAGIYGMNFQNMPELDSRVGYPLVLVVMVSVASGMVAYFRRRGWIGRRR
jgi:magnesium transporter